MADEPRTRPTTDDIGKDVYDETGDRLGELTAVEGRSLVVDTDPSLTDRIKTTLGWGDTQDVYRVDEPSVDRITGDAIHVRTGSPAATGSGPREESTTGAGSDEGMTTTGQDAGDRPTTGSDVSPGGEEPGSPIDADTEPGDVAPDRDRDGRDAGATGTGADETSHRGADEPPTPDETLGSTGSDRDDAGAGESTTTLGESGPAGDAGAETGADRGDRDRGADEPRGMSSDQRDDDGLGDETSDAMDDETPDPMDDETGGRMSDESGDRMNSEPGGETDDERTEPMDEERGEHGEDEDDHEGVTDDELRDAGDGG